MKATRINGSADPKAKANGHANDTTEYEKHDEEQYLDLIRLTLKKGENRFRHER